MVGGDRDSWCWLGFLQSWEAPKKVGADATAEQVLTRSKGADL